MTDSDPHPLETILRQCHQAQPNPWYPSAYAKASGVARDSLDPHLDELRMAGLIRLTEWVPEHGQGYVLTEAGEQVLHSRRQLARLRKGTVPNAAAAGPQLPEEPGSSPWDRGDAVRAAFHSPVRPRVALALLYVNLVWFAVGFVLAAQKGMGGEYLSLFGAPAQILHQIGAISPLDVERGQWWRLLTCCFVHIGLLHLGMNMYFLYALGSMVESMFGHVRFLILYLLAGFGGSCAMAVSLWLRGGGFGAGASGALWGIMIGMGAWIVLNRTHLPQPLVRDMLRRLRNCILLNVFISLAPGISAAGHFGGGAAGLVAAVLLNYDRFADGWQRLPARLGLICMPVVCVLLMLRFQGVGHARLAPFAEDLPEEGVPALSDPSFAQGLRVAQRAERYFETHVAPLLKEDARERDEMNVKLTAARLPWEIHNLKQAEEALKKGGPYPQRSPPALLQRWFQEEAKLFAESARCLEERGDWADDKLVQQVQRVKRVEDDLGQAQKRLSGRPPDAP
jgi:membrane associated rhomboid family serine protease